MSGFDKTDYLEHVNMLSLSMLYAQDNKTKGASRDKLLALVKDLADEYGRVTSFVSSNCGGCEGLPTKDEENRPQPKSVCKFTYETMSARCKRSLGKGFYYIFIKPKFEIGSIKESVERKRKEADERCFG